MKIVCALLLAVAHGVTPTNGFSPVPTDTNPATNLAAAIPSLEDIQLFQVISAPIKYIGPYPTLALRFPNLATSNQRKRNQSGVSLDFVLNTAANTNTITESVASELSMKRVGMVGAGAAGSTYMMGDTKLDGKEEDFMSGLTAAGLPVGSPASAGMLGLAFLQSFAGADFIWGTVEDGEIIREPQVDFYGGNVPQMIRQGRTRVKTTRVPVTDLILVKIVVGGEPMTALLDTSSPITVLTEKAASKIGLVAKKITDEKAAAASGDILSVADAQGKRLDLIKTTESTDFQLDGDSKVDFGTTPLYVGDLPALQVLNGMGLESPPSVVLGLDVLARRPAMLMQAKDNELWFE